MTDPRKPLAPRQRELLGHIEHLTRETGYPPSISELGAAMGIRSTNGVGEHLNVLRRHGYVTWQPFKSRTLRILPPPQPAGPVYDPCPACGSTLYDVSPCTGCGVRRPLARPPQPPPAAPQPPQEVILVMDEQTAAGERKAHPDALVLLPGPDGRWTFEPLGLTAEAEHPGGGGTIHVRLRGTP